MFHKGLSQMFIYDINTLGINLFIIIIIIISYYVINQNSLAYYWFSISQIKYIVRMISKTSLSIRIAKVMSGLSHVTCHYVKVDLYPKKIL